MKKVLRTPADGANAERQAIKAKVRRMLAGARMVSEEMEGTGLEVQAIPALTDLVLWIGKRDERYKRRPGGLGKRSAKTLVARVTPAYVAQMETPQVIRYIESLYDIIDESQARMEEK